MSDFGASYFPGLVILFVVASAKMLIRSFRDRHGTRQDPSDLLACLLHGKGWNGRAPFVVASNYIELFYALKISTVQRFCTAQGM